MESLTYPIEKQAKIVSFSTASGKALRVSH
jgi:hypothetical protein